ncbi:MAG: metal-binding protein [Cyanobacteria bacterium]|nr:metal-binding protein [Cyanobacteriota bacterium]
MATGITHDRIALASLPAGWLLSDAVFHASVVFSLALMLGLWLGGLYLSPDLDTPSRPYFRWGLLRFCWKPYQWMVRHRSNLSHGWILAPFIRLLYAGCCFILLVKGLFSFSLPYEYLKLESTCIAFVSNHGPLILSFILGIWLSHLLHVTSDHLSSRLKRICFKA